jgi:hypothetical protein
MRLIRCTTLRSPSVKKKRVRGSPETMNFAGEASSGTVHRGWGKLEILAAHDVSAEKMCTVRERRLARFRFAAWRGLGCSKAGGRQELDSEAMVVGKNLSIR